MEKEKLAEQLEEMGKTSASTLQALQLQVGRLSITTDYVYT